MYVCMHVCVCVCVCSLNPALFHLTIGALFKTTFLDWDVGLSGERDEGREIWN